MSDPTIVLTLAIAGLAGLAMLTAAAYRAWRDWLALRARELAAPPPPAAGARIELADLKERVRKLEAIAAGVEL